MIHEKSFTVSLNISVTEMYDDIDVMIMRKLKFYYEKRCFAQALILEVKNIQRKSPILLSKHKNDGEGTVDVIFLASVVTYSKGEILHNCKVVSITSNDIISCVNEHATIMLSTKYLKKNTTFKINQKIPVIAGQLLYNIGAETITVMAFPLIPYRSKEIHINYRIMNELSNPDKQKLGNIIKLINDELELKNAMSAEEKKAWEFFNKLLYPFKSVFNLDTKNKCVISLMDLVDNNLTNTVISRHSLINKSLPYVFHTILDTNVVTLNSNWPVFPKSAEFSNEFIKNTPAFDVLFMMMNEYLIYLRDLKEFAAIYNTTAIRTENNNLWDLYEQYKL
jgi:hypothetical protein